MTIKKDNVIHKQGDIFLCDLSENTKDSEQFGLHPVVVISFDARNKTSPNLFIYPITSAKKKYQPCHYYLYQRDYGFFDHIVNTVQCEEGRSISKSRLHTKLGSINRKDVEMILRCKEYVFKEFNK